MNENDYDFVYRFFDEMNKRKAKKESDFAEMAEQLYRIFQAFQVAGFERDEALELLIAIVGCTNVNC